MSALENMETRINYNGGKEQQARMNESKLRSLKKALLYSYQAATATLADGRDFKCLINPDKLKPDYDDKIISIPFSDICLNAERIGKTAEGIQIIGMKAGDVFTWKENNTKWLVYLQMLEETAYFRAEIRKCNYAIEIDGKSYDICLAGPSETMIDWVKKNIEVFNKENYTTSLYVTKDETTSAFFHRFSVIKINNKPWEVQAIDDLSIEGVIEVALKETYSNTIEDAVEEERNAEKEEIPTIKPTVYIDGPEITFPYGEESYSIVGASEGTWEIDTNKVIITNQTETTVNIEVVTGKSGNFTLKYKRENEDDIELFVTIESL